MRHKSTYNILRDITSPMPKNPPKLLLSPLSAPGAVNNGNINEIPCEYSLPSADQQYASSPYRCSIKALRVHVNDCALKYEVCERIVTITEHVDALAKLVHSACGVAETSSDWSGHWSSAVKFAEDGPENNFHFSNT